MALGQNPDLQGILLGQLHADDHLLYVTKPHVSLPSIVKVFEEFGLAILK